MWELKCNYIHSYHLVSLCGRVWRPHLVCPTLVYLRWLSQPSLNCRHIFLWALLPRLMPPQVFTPQHTRPVLSVIHPKLHRILIILGNILCNGLVIDHTTHFREHWWDPRLHGWLTDQITHLIRISGQIEQLVWVLISRAPDNQFKPIVYNQKPTHRNVVPMELGNYKVWPAGRGFVSVCWQDWLQGRTI